MIPAVYVSGQGPSESVNADHVDHWAIEGGHVYLVCDGIDHNHHTAATVRSFCRTLRKADWSSNNSLSTQLVDNILNSVNSLKVSGQAVAFCLSALVITEDSAVVGHCGDCRVGNLTQTGVEWLTVDDVPFLNMYKNGLMTKARYEQSRHYLACKLKTGTSNHTVMKTSTVPRPAAGHLLLCSDGFWAEKEHLLTGSPSQCRAVIEQAIPDLEVTAQDNFSVIVV